MAMWSCIWFLVGSLQDTVDDDLSGLFRSNFTSAGSNLLA
jgi:hypothetical protein